MRITSKGQVTIPRWIRDELGLLPETEVEFVLDGAAVRIVKSSGPARKATRGRRAVEGLRRRATTKMSTDQIMALTRGA